MGYLGEGSYSYVIKAIDLAKNKLVAVKVLKNKFKDIKSVFNLQEIKMLKILKGIEGVITLVNIL